MSTDKKRIWIINQYASNPDVGMGGRHYYLSRELAKKGHEVHLVASSYGHKMRRPPAVRDKVTIQELDGFKMVWVRLPKYSGSGSPVRILNWFRFALDLRLVPEAIGRRPDVVYYSSPSLIGYLGAERLAKKLRAKLVFEVRDIWPLTLQKVGGFSPNHPLLRLMAWVERRAYRNADALISNLQAADVHIERSGGDPSKFSWVPNGILRSEVSEPDPLPSSFTAAVPKDKFVVGYTGAIGRVNAIECLLEAARIIQTSHPNIAFLLVGGGEHKPKFTRLAKANGLRNVLFFDPVAKSQVQSVLAQCDACYIGWLDDDLYEFGIGANKIPEYLYSGKPVIHSYSGGCDPIQRAGAGITVPANDPQKLSEAIVRLSSMPHEERMRLGKNGREYALQHYDFERLASKLESILFNE